MARGARKQRSHVPEHERQFEQLAPDGFGRVLFEPSEYEPKRCKRCSALVPDDCQHDYERRNGYRKGSRPAACLVSYQTDLPEGF